MAKIYMTEELIKKNLELRDRGSQTTLWRWCSDDYYVVIRSSNYRFKEIDSWTEPGLIVPKEIFQWPRPTFLYYDMVDGLYRTLIDPELAPNIKFTDLIISELIGYIGELKITTRFWKKSHRSLEDFVKHYDGLELES